MGKDKLKWLAELACVFSVYSVWEIRYGALFAGVAEWHL